MSKLTKTIFKLEVNDKEFHAHYNGSLTRPETKEQRKHNERLMLALMASDELLNFLYQIVMPVIRYKRREARRNAPSPLASRH